MKQSCAGIVLAIFLSAAARADEPHVPAVAELQARVDAVMPFSWITGAKLWEWHRRVLQGYVQLFAIVYCGFLLFWCIAAIAITLYGRRA